MQSICVEVSWCAGHRIKGHSGKCKHLHGHNYRAEVCFHGDLDKLGMVLDFGPVKAVLNDYVDRTWDHAMIIWQEDTEALQALLSMPEEFQRTCPTPFNPTAEALALHLLQLCNEWIARGVFDCSALDVVCTRVTVWETSKCSATATIDEVPDHV